MQQQRQIKVADHLARWQTIAITLEKASNGSCRNNNNGNSFEL